MWLIVLSRPCSGVTHKDVVRIGNWVCLAYRHNRIQSLKRRLQQACISICTFTWILPWSTETSSPVLIYLCVASISREWNLEQTKSNSAALSPQANYADWATVICRRNLVPTFLDKGVSRGERGGSPAVVNLSFLDRIRYFSFKELLIHSQKGWVDPVPDPLLLRKSGRSENRTRDLWVSGQELWTLDHSGGPKSWTRN
jgi:hypothetical protein